MCSYRLQCQLTTLSKTRDEGHLFEKSKWPNTDLVCSNNIFLYSFANTLSVNLLTVVHIQRVQVKRLYSLLTIKDSASSIPKNLEARRRLEFFTNSLFMKMPRAKPVREMLSFRYLSFSLEINYSTCCFCANLCFLTVQCFHPLLF